MISPKNLKLFDLLCCVPGRSEVCFASQLQPRFDVPDGDFLADMMNAKDRHVIERHLIRASSLAS